MKMRQVLSIGTLCLLTGLAGCESLSVTRTTSDERGEIVSVQSPQGGGTDTSRAGPTHKGKTTKTTLSWSSLNGKTLGEIGGSAFNFATDPQGGLGYLLGGAGLLGGGGLVAGVARLFVRARDKQYDLGRAEAPQGPIVIHPGMFNYPQAQPQSGSQLAANAAAMGGNGFVSTPTQ